MSEAVRGCLLDAEGDADCVHNDIAREVRASGLHLNREAVDRQHGFGRRACSAAREAEQACSQEYREQP